MLRHLAQPLHAGIFVVWVGPTGADIYLTGNGLVDEGLLVLFQQLDPLLPGANGAPYPPVHVIEKTHDRGLLGEGWNRNFNLRKLFPSQTAASINRSTGIYFK